MNKEYTPYTYLIGWSSFDRWYYGSEFKNNKNGVAHPSNLWRSYFTSSKDVKLMREKCGEPDVVAVRRTFDTRGDCILWEYRVLRRLKASTSGKWLNRSIQHTAIQPHTWGEEQHHKSQMSWTIKRRAKMAKLAKERPMSIETREKISSALTGRTVSQETRSRQSASRKGRIITPEWRAKISEYQKGRHHSPEHNAKVGLASKRNWQNDEYRQKMLQKSGARWEITHPDGSKEIIVNLSKFCRDNSLTMSSLSQSGKNGKLHKGYSATKLSIP